MEKIKIQEILDTQFIKAGDTQDMNGNVGINARYSVNRRWLNSFAKLIVEAVVDKCLEEAYCDIVHPPDKDYPELEESETVVIKESILQVKQMIDYE